jgi:hypothetical protein
VERETSVFSQSLKNYNVMSPLVGHRNMSTALHVVEVHGVEVGAFPYSTVRFSETLYAFEDNHDGPCTHPL